MQKELYKRYYSYGVSIAIRYAKDKDDAIWLLNQAFMKVFENLKSFDLNQLFRPWFRRILINTILGYNKKYYRFEHEDVDQIKNIDSDDDIIGDLSYEQILTQVQLLTPAYKIVLTLYLVDGYKHSEIAEELGISEGASKSNLFKAKEMLKTLLKNNLGIER